MFLDAVRSDNKEWNPSQYWMCHGFYPIPEDRTAMLLSYIDLDRHFRSGYTYIFNIKYILIV